MTRSYAVSLNIKQVIDADNEEEALNIFHDDTMRAWGEEEIADIQPYQCHPKNSRTKCETCGCHNPF